MNFKMIDCYQMMDNVDVHYFGWSESEIDILNKNYQSKFFGGDRDLRFYCIDDEGNEYYAIFKGYALNQYGEELDFPHKKVDWLLLKDNNRVLINVFGQLYRFVINDKICLPISQFKDFFESITYPQSYVPSISSYEYGLMIFSEKKIVAISWDKIIWQYQLENSGPYDFELLSIDQNHVHIHHKNGFGTDKIIKLSLQNGMST